MVIIIVKCQNCGTETKLSLADISYDGLFRCWKCKHSHMFVVENDEIKYLRLLNNDKCAQQLELDL